MLYQTNAMVTYNADIVQKLTNKTRKLCVGERKLMQKTRVEGYDKTEGDGWWEGRV